MLKIRLQRIGRRNNPSYRVVVVDSATAAKKGKPVEVLGTYDTIRKTTSLHDERILYWISTGAQVSDTMHNILIKNGVIEGVKVNVLPRKSPVKKKKGDDTEKVSQEETATNTPQASDTVATDTENTTEGKKDDASEEVPESNASDNTSPNEEQPQSPPPQDTPSAEG